MLRIFLRISIFVSVCTITASRPIAMASLLLAIATLTAFTLGIILRAWFFYFLLLVFLGGVIVVVLFIVSVCSNKKLIIGGKLRLTILGLVAIFIRALPVRLHNSNYSTSNIIFSLYKTESRLIFIGLILTLVLCIIRVISVSKLESGPLVKRL